MVSADPLMSEGRCERVNYCELAGTGTGVAAGAALGVAFCVATYLGVNTIGG